MSEELATNEVREDQFRKLTENFLELSKVRGQSVLRAMKKDDTPNSPDVVVINPVDGSKMHSTFGGHPSFFTVSDEGINAYYVAGTAYEAEAAFRGAESLASVLGKVSYLRPEKGSQVSEEIFVDLIAGQAGEAAWVHSVDATRGGPGTAVEQAFYGGLSRIGRTLDGQNLNRLLDASENAKKRLSQPMPPLPNY